METIEAGKQPATLSRRRLLGWLLAGGLGVAAGVTAGVTAGAAPRVIPVTARRFVFSPDKIMLRAGESVVFELTALDVVMGFSVPDLGIRADLPPGKVVRVPVTAGAAASHVFLCDIFCGSGHENMNGMIVVS
jgi:cytochrome c oxidase subunit 2